MDWQLIGISFITVFLAEIGDKSQLAAIALAAHFLVAAMDVLRQEIIQIGFELIRDIQGGQDETEEVGDEGMD